MTPLQAEAIFKANAVQGQAEGFEACMAVGYLIGLGKTVTSSTPLNGVLALIANPASIPTYKSPEVR